MCGQKKSLNNPTIPIVELIDSHVEKETPFFELTAAHMTIEFVVASNAKTKIVTPSERIRRFLVTAVGLAMVRSNETIKAYAIVSDKQTVVEKAMIQNHLVLEKMLGKRSSAKDEFNTCGLALL